MITCLQKLFEYILSFIEYFNLRNYFISNFVFHPPDLPSYTLRKTKTLLELSKHDTDQNRKQTNTYLINEFSRKQSRNETEQNRKNTNTIIEPSRKLTKQTDGNSFFQPLIITEFSIECIQKNLYLQIAGLSEMLHDKDGIRYHITGIEKVQQIRSQQSLKEESKIEYVSPDITRERNDTHLNDKYMLNEIPQRTADLEIYQLILISSKRTIIPYEMPPEINLSAHIVGDNHVPLLYFELCENLKSELLLIHSHGNSCDMGQIIDTYLDISYNTRVNVIGYDYPGYGQSLGEPNDINTTEALETVFRFAINQLGFNQKNIILYGQSIGSGPTLKLAAKEKVGGVVLHSAFTSVLRVINPNIQNDYELFLNIENIRNVTSMVMIVHGSEDKQIPLEHGEALSKASKNLQSFIVIPGAGHNDIEIEDRYKGKLYLKLREFINAIKQQKKVQEIIYKLGLKEKQGDEDLYSTSSKFQSLDISFSQQSLSQSQNKRLFTQTKISS